jgi:O-succinylbenzoic acid--CoA ligase
MTGAPAMLVPDWLRRRAQDHPHDLALAAGGERLTFGELDGAADRAARQLAGLGVEAGTRAALLLPSGAVFVILTHALARLGAVMVPLNTRLAPAEIDWQVRDSQAAVLIHNEVALASPQSGGTEIPARRVDIADLQAAATPDDLDLRDRIDLSAPQGIIYTSATTGRPKGVMLTFGNHWWSAVGSALHLSLQRHDAWLAVLPLYHVGGLAILWRGVIYGMPVHVHESFDPAAVNGAIDRGEVTIVSVVATMLQRVLDDRGTRPLPATFRCFLLGGGPARRALLERCVRGGVPVATTYGLTEAASQVATLPPAEFSRKLGSAGRPLLATRLQVAAPAGEVGEILVRGPTVMRGYADRPQETAAVLRDGWLHTGDLGYLDAEGYLFVVERRDDLIISGGENVYPTEVEHVLREHPAIADAGVIGIPDATWGQVVGAAVRLRAGAHLTGDDVRRFCGERLARYKIPRHVWFVDDLPRSAGGKLLRRVISAPPGSPAGNGAGLSAAPEDRRRWVRDAFHAIATRYDTLNHILSGGVHLLWKRAAVRAAGLRPGEKAADVCCGTGDMVIGLARAAGVHGRVLGLDFAPGMLAGAARRLAAARVGPIGGLICGDAEALPVREESLDAVTFAFGLRNVPRPAVALAEARRVLRPGGRLVVLEFGQPRSRWLRAVYDLYSKTVIPRLGGWLSGRRDAYQYLHDSIRQWADPEALAVLMRDAGLADVTYRPLTGGIAVLHVGRKPASPAPEPGRD